MASLGLGTTPGGSPHGDVLSAPVPPDADGAARLVEELRSRGRAAVLAGNYRDAEMLYGRAIEVLTPSSEKPKEGGGGTEEGESAVTRRKDLAILHSNRSLSRLQMGRTSDARSDAEVATELDPTYVKGHWRLGQACSAMGCHGDALEAFEGALRLDGNNKALRREAEKARARVERERLLVMGDEFDGGPGNGGVVGAAKKPTSKQKPVAVPKSSSAGSANADDDDNGEDGDVFSKSDHVRGYKVVGGKKTSYFHREQTEEERRLIGDITPKPITSPPPASSSASSSSEAVGRNDGVKSAWNEAGTWEERDVSAWAADTLPASVTGVTYAVPPDAPAIGGSTVRAARVEAMDLHGGGHASVAAVRGRKRYIYEYGLRVRWELEHPDGGGGEDCAGTMTGTMTFPDVDGTVEPGGEYDLGEFKVDGNVGNALRAALNEHVRDGGLRTVIHGAIDGWVELFRATY